MKIILEQAIKLYDTNETKLIKKEYETNIAPIVAVGVNTDNEYMNSGIVEQIILDFENNCTKVYLSELELKASDFNK